MRNNCPYSGEALGFRRQDSRDGRYLGGVPGLVLQGPCDDVVAQVEDEEADDKQRAHTAPHDLPVPVQGASGHGLELAFKSDRRVGRESLDYPCSWRQAVQATEPSVHKKLLCWAPVVLGHDHGALSPGGGSRAQAATRGGQSDCPQVSGHQDMPLGPASKWRPLMQTGGQRPALAGRGPGETPVKPASAPGALRAALPSVSSCSACSPPP